MTPTRFASIRARLAAILDQCAPALVPVEQLQFELNLQLLPPATLAEFEHVLARMEAARQIMRHPSDRHPIE